jgi:cellulose synthase operon protein C
MMARVFPTLVLGLAVSVALSGCQSSEERAQDYYESGQELVAEGDLPRAYLEFRNALKLQPNDPRILAAYAVALEEGGHEGQAYGRRLRAAELLPDDVEANRKVAQMAVVLQDWQNAEIYTQRTAELEPESPETEVLQLALRYRDALDDAGRRASLLGEAETLREDLPDSRILRTLILDALLRSDRDEEALTEAESLIQDYPALQEFYRARLQILARLGREEEMETTLRDMVERFPEDEESKSLLVRYYLSRNDLDSAEGFLRDQAEAEGESQDARRLTLVRFLRDARGPQAALAEIERLLEDGADPVRFRAMRAALRFETGDHDEAISDLQALVEEADPSEQTLENKILLATFQQATGNEVRARQLVEEVLAEDPNMSAALKMRAGWQIADDRSEEAVNTLRAVLNETPDDTEALTMLANAHMRNGSQQLAGDTLAQAVRASSNAPDESRRYADFLVADEKLGAAETVLTDALRMSPQNVALLIPLGQIYVQLEDWPQAEVVAQRLREVGGEDAITAADELKVSILSGQRSASEALAYLEELASDNQVPAQAAVVQMNMRMGNTDRARSYLDDLLAEEPDNQVYRFLDAALLDSSGDFETAAERYRTLAADHPQNPRYRVELYRTLSRDGDYEAARQAIEAGLEAMPNASDLLWIKAGLLEREGDTEGAISIYETLYESQSGNSIVANNLASLLSTSRDDKESLDRAWRISRRLRETDVPAFLDTYGWIAYRRGDYQTALDALVPASEAMTDQPLVLYHLGETYAALGRTSEARETLSTAAQMAERSDRPLDVNVATQARAALDTLEGG